MTLVIGGRGFIGTNYINRYGGESFDLVDGQDACPFDEAPWKLESALTGHDTIVHLASNADIAAGAESPWLDLHGIDITRNVCEAARDGGVSRIIYLSGSGVYGHRSVHATEETPTYPISPYGASKLASEAILNAYAAMYGISVLILRPANIVGPHQTHGVGYDFMRKLREDPTQLEILGNGMQTKQYLHVDDLLDAMDSGLTGTYNVAPDTTLPVRYIATYAMEQLGLGVLPLHIEGSKLAWPGDIPRVELDCTKLKATGWRARSSQQAMRAALRVL